MRRKGLILVVLLAAALVAGCRIEPPLHLKQAVKVVVKVLWRAEIYPDGIKPSGVTLYFFRNGEYYNSQTTAQVDSCAVHLEPGKYRIFMISQSPDEFAYMEFHDMENFDLASVSVMETKSKWYTRADEEFLINNPEQMTVGVSDEFEITPEMVEQYRYYSSEEGGWRSWVTKADTESGSEQVDDDTWVTYYTIRIPIYPRNIVSQYWVTIYSEYADVLQSVRCSTTGMARSFYLTQDITGPDEGTQFVTEWKLTMDDNVSRVGHLDGKVTTFGFPNGELPGPDRDPTLNVSTLLVDNKTVQDYVFKVGNLITAEEAPEGYRALYRLILGSEAAPAIHPPDVEKPEDAQGLDALVNEWDSGDEVEVDM